MSREQKKEDIFSLNALYENVKNNVFEIPTVQRGFVWKPHQIENLWDSLLRGYPIGSIVLHEVSVREKNEGDFSHIEILDGQQRISSICLGMNYEDIEILKTSSKNIRIFIDLGKPNADDNRKYIFRVVTKSHPWGYKRSDNTKTLESKHIRAFQKRVLGKSEAKILELGIDKYIPFDALEPVPLSLFVKAVQSKKNVDELEKDIQKWKDENYKEGDVEEDGSDEVVSVKEKVKEIRKYTVKEIFEAIKCLLDECRGLKMPALYLNFEKIQEDSVMDLTQKDDIEQEDEETENNSNKEKDEIENMFIRLNSAGTLLSGEELNYSMFKSYLLKETKEKIEEACVGIIKPSRFITFAFRLWKRKKQDDDKRGFYRLVIKPKIFQKEFRGNEKKSVDSKTEFKDYVINDLIDVLQIIKKLLLYDEFANPDGFPFLMVNRLSQKSPEVMFMLLYRLAIKGDKIEGELHKRMLGIISLFSWFGTGEQNTGHRQLLRNIYPAMDKLKIKEFWSSEVVTRALIQNQKGDVLTKIPATVKDLRAEFDDLTKKHKSNKNNGSFKDTSYFIDKITSEKELLLYIQRKHLKSMFSDDQFLLDDTNVPFDWDHIFPQDYIRSRPGINKTLRDWYSTNGNLWACSYEFNRRFHDLNPSEKMKPKNIKTEQTDHKELCIVVKNEALDCNKDNIKNKQKEVYDFILNRNLELCIRWYKNLNIADLIPGSIKKEESFFDLYLDNKQWISVKDKAGGDYTHYRELSLENDIKLYIGFDEGDLLKEDCIEFGIISRYELKIQKDLKKELRSVFLDDGEHVVYQVFTLVSVKSVSLLFDEIQEFLRKMSLDGKKNQWDDLLKISIKNINP